MIYIVASVENIVNAQIDPVGLVQSIIHIEHR